METKQWLSRGWFLQQEIDSLKEAERHALAKATSMSAPIREAISHTAAERADDKLIAYADGGYIDSIRRQCEKLMQILHEISAAIYAVDDGVLRTLLINRYILFKSWEQISLDMNYSWRQIHRIHSKALNEVEKVAYHVT